MRAIVVWHDHGIHWLDRFLKPGFKHCFVAVEADGQWITLDGRAGLPVVEIVAPSDYDLAAFYRERGYAVIETKQRGRVPLMPFVPANCVGLVRGILAIGAFWVLTPWQLYVHMARAESPGFQLLPGKSDAAPDKPGKITVAVKGLKNLGRDGDTELAHVNPAEKRMLKAMGGSGTINPKTGLREFKFGGGGHGASRESATADRGGSQRDGGRDRASSTQGYDFGAFGPTRREGKSWAGGLDDDGADVTIERRKSTIDVAPGDERGGQSQRDGALLLSVTVDAGGELGGGGSGGGASAKDKDDERTAGRAATLLSASKGIRDKLGRSGRRSPGKSLG